MFGPRCTANRFGHKFDKVTHRCGCGRWERGFKPAKEFVKDRAECQICGCQQACNVDKTLGHHGYKRPGFGFIQGDCFGQGHKPFPATDALKKWLVATTNYVARKRSELAGLPSVGSFVHKFQSGKFSSRKNEVVVVNRGDLARLFVAGEPWGPWIPSFEYLEERQKIEIEAEIKSGVAEINRISERIVKAKEGSGVA